MSTDDQGRASHAGGSAAVVAEATAEELDRVLAVQHDAFARVAKALDLPVDRLPPLRERLADLRALYESGMRFFVARADGEVVGTVRAETRGDGVVEIGRLAVDGRYLRRGVATELMRVLERAYPDAERFELFTGAEARQPLALYHGLGYEDFREETHGGVGLVWLAKQR